MLQELPAPFRVPAERQRWIDLRNAERLAAYQQKLRVWREQHPEDYWVRLRRGLTVRWKWQRLWERQDRAARQDVALFLRRASEHPAFGAGV